jgi:spectinomycin phosphotransferase
MRHPPTHISNETIRACLRQHYALGDFELLFMPLGEDTLAWAYRVEPASGAPQFLKLRRGQFNQPSLDVPFFLHKLGVDTAVAPLPNDAGALWTPFGEDVLVLYPFVEGRMGASGGLSDAQWVALGQATRRMHDAPLPPGLMTTLRRERFVPDYREPLHEVTQLVAADALTDDLGRELAQFWRAHTEQIESLVARAGSLGESLRARELPHVLCHADLHTYNVLAGDGGRLWIVDWDEVTFAPRERDLMFVIGGISAKLVTPQTEALFFEGYGPYTLNRDALAYYHTAWAVQDIGSYAERVVLMPELTEAARRDALDILVSLFAPGEIVEIAVGRLVLDRARFSV